MLLATASAELERTAAAYRQAASVLKGVPERAELYLAQLEHAQQVHWHSEAGEAFRQLVEGLRHPGNLLESETQRLAGVAEVIAADLSSYAEAARQLSTMVAVLAAVDITAVAQDLGLQQLDAMRGAASEAVTDAAKFVQFVDDNGGIPWLLQEAAARVW